MEDEEDTEVMAVVAAKRSRGRGSFYKKSGGERGPFRRRDRRQGEDGGGERMLDAGGGGAWTAREGGRPRR